MKTSLNREKMQLVWHALFEFEIYEFYASEVGEQRR